MTTLQNMMAPFTGDNPVTVGRLGDFDDDLEYIAASLKDYLLLRGLRARLHST